MPMKRFNIWLDTELVSQVEKVAKTLGLRKTTYMRMAIVDKLRRDTDAGQSTLPHGDILDREQHNRQDLHR